MIHKTFMAKPGEVEQRWWLVDANEKKVGRLASDIATILMGKHRPTYTPHVDTGDYIVIVNAAKVAVTGNKYNDKMYHHHTGYVGNLKSVPFNELLAKKPEEVIQKAVKGMLPKGPLGREMARKMKVFAGGEHTHAAQQPQLLDI